MKKIIILLVTLIILFHTLKCTNDDYVNTTDLSKCKISHLGLEFLGKTAQTEGGVRCQNWDTESPIHKINSSFKDEHFSDFSMKKAKNYCRNPNRDPKGPWCYTMNAELIDDTCGIPLCSFTECKITGAGMEYAGIRERSNSGKKCLKWDKHRKKIKDKAGTREQSKFPKQRFPDETRATARKYCRNPDGDIGGPWCFVEIEHSGGMVEKQYCYIPFCDIIGCITFTKHFQEYTHFTEFDRKLTNLTFGLKIWDPDSYFNSSATLLLSLFPLPLKRNELNEMHIAIEIYISNTKSGMTVGNKDKSMSYEVTKGVLKSSEYTFFSLMWASGFVTLTIQGNSQPLFLQEYKVKNNLFAMNKDTFFYYSLQGKNVLWSLNLCDEDDECEVHLTTSDQFERYNLLRKTETGFDLQIYVRAFHSALIRLQTSPTVEYPNVKITLFHKNISIVSVQASKEAPEIKIKETTILNMLNFWEWKELSITMFGKIMQIFWKGDMGTQMILEVEHQFIALMRWYSSGSYDTLVYWTFYCFPDSKTAEVPNPWPPECVLNQKEVDYKGTQWVTNEGHVCTPWTHDKKIVSKYDYEYVLTSLNYCRDMANENRGTYCNAVSLKRDKNIQKSYCHIRLCKSSECRMAGTGNDYIGKVNVTKSNRTCQNWNVNSPHKIDRRYKNSTLYPDKQIEDAMNYCRDPSRNVAGPWCYTTDKDVPMDECGIRDCTKRHECTIVMRTGGYGKNIFILPQWKERGIHGGLQFSLKEWNPNKLDGILFEIIPHEGDGFLKLLIGADNNEKVQLFYGASSKTATLMKEKTMLHLINAGKWSSFWLQIRKGEIMLGYQGMKDSIFEWQHDDMDRAFEPMYMTYMSIQGNIIGINFKCDECHTENSTYYDLARVLPLGLWSERVDNVKYDNVTFYIRGTGIAIIPLLLLPYSSDYEFDFHAITLGELNNSIILLHSKTWSKTVLKKIFHNQDVLYPDYWTTYVLKFTELSLNLFKNGTEVFNYTFEKPFLFYWFSVGGHRGWVAWSANCLPPDIDRPPRDGGWSRWSPWTCSVTCGGGEGFRTRTCSNPRPNIYGKLCEGATTQTGICNEFECGDISTDTMDKVRAYLRSKHFSFIVEEGTEVDLKNNKDLIKIIKKESPNSKFEWSLNGVRLPSYMPNNYTVKNTKSSDNGVYICTLHRINNKRFIIGVFSISVIPNKYSLVTRATYDLTIISNAVVLAYVYMDLSQKWTLNESVIIDYGITSLAAVSSEHILSLNISHNGMWKCIIEQKNLKFLWVTNIIRIRIKNKPNLLSHLMEDDFTKHIFGKLHNETQVLIILIIIFVLVFLVVFLVLFAYFKWGTLPKTKRKNKKRKKIYKAKYKHLKNEEENIINSPL